MSDTHRERLLAEGRAAERAEQLQRRLAGKEAGKKRGRHVHGGIPYGYMTITRGVLVPVEDERREIVQRIFTLIAAGLSPNAVARRLNEDGVPSPLSRAWSGAGVLGIVRNTGYIGERYGVAEAHPALVDVALFRSANDALDGRAERWAASRRKSK